MQNIGNFKEEALAEFSEAYLDFARCQRPDGTHYGTNGQCRKGKETGAKEIEPKKAKAKKAKTEPAEQPKAKRPKKITNKELLAEGVKLVGFLEEDPAYPHMNGELQMEAISRLVNAAEARLTNDSGALVAHTNFLAEMLNWEDDIDEAWERAAAITFRDWEPPSDTNTTST
jgi:hypothetical protein